MPEFSAKDKFRWWCLDKKRTIENKIDAGFYAWRGGYKCTSCGRIIPLPGTEYSGEVNGRRMMLSYYGPGPLCSVCLFGKISSYFGFAPVAGPREYVDEFSHITRIPCDWYPEKDRSIKGVMKYKNPSAEMLNLDIRIGSNYWNGFHASLCALRSLLLVDGVYTTSFLSTEKNETFYCYRGVKVSTKSPKLKVSNVCL